MRNEPAALKRSNGRRRSEEISTLAELSRDDVGSNTVCGLYGLDSGYLPIVSWRSLRCHGCCRDSKDVSGTQAHV